MTVSGNPPVANMPMSRHCSLMRALLSVCLALLVSCTPDVTDEKCSGPAHESYSGVALALATGTATFATDSPYCAFVITGSDALRDEIFEAWKESPYGESNRPIYLSVEGQIIPSKKEGRIPWFEVTNVREVSARFSKEDAQAAYELRWASDLPALRTDAADDEPQERVILTD